ncbi:MAG: hypothetical protein KKI06_08200 [Euryarchaeota archaeon]|nr:hypothetical protein [Euryarchaeota archaeon]
MGDGFRSNNNYFSYDGGTQDSSGNGNHGTMYGAKYVDGIKGQALAFDGMDNYFSAHLVRVRSRSGDSGHML